jgi:transposase
MRSATGCLYSRLQAALQVGEEPRLQAALPPARPARLGPPRGRRRRAGHRRGATPHSSGAVEGNINRLKMLKRQMFGRASLDLLRKRVLLTR